MGKLDISLLRYITSEDVRVLTAIEMGMKNHEIVPFPLIVIISKVRGGNCYKILGNLCKNKLIRYQKDSKSEGYYLTYKGYDYLAIKTLVKQGHISHFGNQIGVGKESDVYIVTNEEGQRLALKIHRLGRNSFRRLREKRDYFKHRSSVSWLYLSRLAATKEYDFMKALYSRRFPVPQPIAHNRHCVVMQLLMDFIPLSQILDETSTNKLFESNYTSLNITNNAIEENFVDYNVEFNAWKKSLFNGLLETLIAFTRCGLIHGDYNEFNIMVKPPPVVITTTNCNHEKMAMNNVGKSSVENISAKFYIIDFPQIISIHHPNAKEYFDRDVNGIVTFFARRLHLFHTGNSEQSELDLIPLPNFEQLYREILNPPSLVQSDTGEQILSMNDTTDLDKYYFNDTDLRNGSENEFEHSADKLSDSYDETDCDNSSCHSFNSESDQDTNFQTNNNSNANSNIIIDPVFDLSKKVSKILLLSSNQNTGNDQSSPNQPQTENMESKHDDMERVLQAKYRMAIRGKDRICIEPTSYSQLRQKIMCNDLSNPLTDQDIRENVQKLIKENQLLNRAKVSKTFTTPPNNKNKEKMAKTAKKQGIRSYKKTQRMGLQKETLRDSQIY